MVWRCVGLLFWHVPCLDSRNIDVLPARLCRGVDGLEKNVIPLNSTITLLFVLLYSRVNYWHEWKYNYNYFFPVSCSSTPFTTSLLARLIQTQEWVHFIYNETPSLSRLFNKKLMEAFWAKRTKIFQSSETANSSSHVCKGRKRSVVKGGGQKFGMSFSLWKLNFLRQHWRLWSVCIY